MTLKPVYDLLNAGPRSRFTVITDAGPMIVSNSILGLGYGMGWRRFVQTLFIGNGGMSVRIEEPEARKIVDLYRSKYHEIPQLWGNAQLMLLRMVGLKSEGHMQTLALQGERKLIMASRTHPNYATIPAIKWGIDTLELPNRMHIQYPNLRIERVADHNDAERMIDEIVYDGGPGRGRVRIYGAKCIENITQALARIVITELMIRVRSHTRYLPFLSTHDSLDYCVPEAEAAVMDRYLEDEFAREPAWAVGLPLASEGGFGQTLRDAESRVNQ